MAGVLNQKTGLLTDAPQGTTINDTGIVNRSITSSPVSVLPGPDRNSLISSTPQAGYIQGYDTNNNYSPVYVPKGQYVPGISATPNQITTDSLKTGSNVKLPGVTDTNTSDASSLVAGASQNIASLVEQLTPPETDANKKQQNILDQIAGLTGEQGNLGTDQLAAEEQAGIPQLRTQLASINGDIQTKLAEYKVLETENQNKPITMNSIIGNERAILNAKASDIGLLQARANALSGNIEAAQQNVDRAVGLKYQTIEARLNTYQAQLNALQPTLNKEEKQQALAQQVLLDQRKQELADEKQEKKDIQGIMVEAIKSGVTDQKVLNQISNAQSYYEALKIAGPSIGSIVQQSNALDTQLKKAQIANIYSEINSRGGGSKDLKIVKINGVDYVQNKDGTFSLPVIQGQTVNTAVTAGLKDKVNQIDKLIKQTDGPGSSVVGPSLLGRGGENFLGIFNINSLTGAQQNFVAGVHQLVAKETVDTLLNLKKAGGTLGALSDQERVLLQNAASKINDWEIKKDNYGTGKWNISQSAFKEELNTLKNLTQRAIQNASGSNGLINNLHQNLAAHPERVAEYNTLVAANPGKTEDEINQLMGF